MKLINVVLIAVLFITLSSIKSYSQDKGFGLGVSLGEPTGLNGKYWLNSSNALDFGLAYSFVHTKSTYSLHADYLFHNSELIKSSRRLPIYYGVGARLHFGNGNKGTLGARGVIGLVWMPMAAAPVDVFIEFAPVFNLFPETSLHIDLSIGGRYYFEQ
ncbi:MAG: hypothetical protein CVV24_12720 [Ignavibacteriae bacterium HGW-Ignavibacteriae-3]|nr:MAG: hypothetical protein CVV24_12720 [Ignavibacteriae bacterium HGW-Ignavibacteriae-3]